MNPHKMKLTPSEQQKILKEREVNAKRWNHIIDASRDRKMKKYGVEKKGSARQSCLDRKNERLQLQAGSSAITYTNELSRALDSKVLSDYVSESAIDLAESVAILSRLLLRSESLMDYATAMITFFKLTSKGSCFSVVSKVVRMILTDSDISLQDGEENETFIRKGLRDWGAIKRSPLFEKIIDIGMRASIMGLYTGPTCFDAKKFGTLRSQFKNQKMYCSASLFECVIDMFEFLGSKLHDVFVSDKSLRELLFNSNTLEGWYTKVRKHLAQSEHLNNPAAFAMDIHKFLNDTHVLCERGEDYLKYMTDENAREKEYIRSSIYKLRKLELDMISKESTSVVRPVPYCVCLEGHSSVGKSAVAAIIHDYFGKLYDKPMNCNERHVKNASANFWDGLNSSQWSLLYDDVACWKTDLNVVDQSISDLVRVLNNIPFVPDQAKIEDKGRIPLLSELVVLTTNVPDLRVDEYYNYPLAAARRVPYHIRMRPIAAAGTALDKTKTEMVDGRYSNSWIFDIYEPTGVGIGIKRDGFQPMGAHLKRKQSDMDMGQLLEFIRVTSTEHRNHQNRLINMLDSYKDIKLCDKCRMPIGDYCICDNIETQGFVGDVTYSLFISMCVYWIINYIPFWRNYFYEIQVRFCYRYICWRLRNRQVHMRDRIMRSLDIPVKTTLCVGLVALIPTILAVYGIMKLSREEKKNKNADIKPQGNIFSDQAIKPESLGEKESFWRQDTMIPSTFDSTKRSLALKGQSEENLQKKLLKSTAYFVFEHDTRTVCHGINICGNQYMLPNHCVVTTNGVVKCTVTRGTPGQSFADAFSFIMSEKDMRRDLKQDIVIIKIKVLPCGADIRDLFIKKACVENPGRAHYISITKNKGIKKFDTYFTFHCENVVVSALDMVGPQWKSPGIITEGGDCGMMLYRVTDLGVQILGMHQNFDKTHNSAGAIALTYEYINSLDFKDEVGVVEVQLGSEKIRNEIVPLKENSILRSIPYGTLEVYGNLCSKTRRRSKVKPHLLYDDLIKLGFEQEYFTPNLASDKPWKTNIIQQVDVDCLVSNDVLNTIKDQMLLEWVEKTPQKFKDEIAILDLETVVNGIAGRKYIDSINKSSSMGHPFNKQKKHFLTELPQTEDHQHPVEFDREIVERYERQCMNASKADRNFPIFRASLKDEAVTQRKIAANKVRVFMGAPVDFTLLMRSALLSFIRVAQSNRYIFEGAPGIEAQGEDWQSLFEYLTAHGENQCVFGDFAGFDTSMRANFMIAAFELIAEFHRACGASDEHINAIRSIAMDVTFPMVEYNGDLVSFYGVNPSGQALTVTLNGIINCMYMRYCYLTLNPRRELLSFRSNVNLITYGDDNGMGISPKIPWFNHTSITKALSNINIKYTMADKLSDSVPYISIYKADFLKRKWRYEPQMSRHVCPLEIKSIIKSLMIGVKKQHLSEHDHTAQVLDQALAEFFWHGEEIFLLWRTRFIGMVESYHLHGYLPSGKLLTWKDHIIRYGSRGSKSNCDDNGSNP